MKVTILKIRLLVWWMCAIQNWHFMWSDAVQHPNTCCMVSCLWVDSQNHVWCKTLYSFILPIAWRSLLN